MKQPKCATCGYRDKAGMELICGYLLITGHRRPCPPGAECTEYKKESRLKMKRTWDTDEAARLYAEGMSDAEIAAAVGATTANVGYWRRSAELPANAKKPAESSPPTEPLTSQPPEANAIPEPISTAPANTDPTDVYGQIEALLDVLPANLDIASREAAVELAVSILRADIRRRLFTEKKVIR